MRTLHDILVADPDFSIWSQAVARAGLLNLFSSAQELTLFAPYDSAFTDGDDLLAPQQAGETGAQIDRRLNRLVRSHLMQGLHDLSDIERPGAACPTIDGGQMIFIQNGSYNLTMERTRSAVTAEAAIVVSPIVASNGLLYPLTRIYIF